MDRTAYFLLSDVFLVLVHAFYTSYVYPKDYCGSMSAKTMALNANFISSRLPGTEFKALDFYRCCGDTLVDFIIRGPLSQPTHQF